VLTWWQGTGLGGLSSGTDYIYNARYQQIATVRAGNGYSAAGHEFLIPPQGTALILAYTTATANLTAIGGPPDQTVIDGIVARSTSAPAGCSSSATAPITSRTPPANSRCPPRPPRRGTGFTSTPCTWTPTQPEGLPAASQGNVQSTRNGDPFVGWGALPCFSEFSPSSQLEFNARSSPRA
jgi:hypothetical protein